MAEGLPTFSDLGSIGISNTRAEQPDFSATARAAARMTQTAAESGRGAEALGRGIEQLGQGIGAAIDANTNANDRLELANANAAWQTSQINLKSDLAAQTEVPDALAYKKQFSDALTAAASGISNERARQIFIAGARPGLATSLVATQDAADKIGDNQTQAYTNQQLSNLRDSTLKSTNPEDFISAVNTAGAAYDALAERQILTPQQAQANKDKWTQDLAQSAIAMRTPQEQMAILGPNLPSGAGIVPSPHQSAALPIASGRTVDLARVDPRLNTNLALAGQQFGEIHPGYSVQAIEGYNSSGHVANSAHHKAGSGAVDVQIIGPQGNAIPNEGADPSGLYHDYARLFFQNIERNNPELRGQAAWGGAFGTNGTNNVPDLMHFDLSGERGHITENLPGNLGPIRPIGGPPPTMAGQPSVYSMIDKATSDPAIAAQMRAIFEGESEHRIGYDQNLSGEASYGPFQLNKNGGLGAVFQRETGLDPADPSTAQMQANWIANYIATTGDVSPWRGYQHGVNRIAAGNVHPMDTIFGPPGASGAVSGAGISGATRAGGIVPGTQFQPSAIPANAPVGEPPQSAPNYDTRLGSLLHPDTAAWMYKQAQMAAQKQTHEQTVALEEERAAVKSLVASDEASLASSGVPVPSIDAVRVSASLGPEAATSFLQNRVIAQNYHTQMGDINQVPQDQLQARVNALAPQPGSSSYPRALQYQQQAQSVIDQLSKDRLASPADAVANMPAVIQATKAYNPDKPETFQGVLAARLTAQKQLGLPPDPATKAEYAQLTAAIEPFSSPFVKDDQKQEIATKVVNDLTARYGPYARQVLTDLIKDRGMTIGNMQLLGIIDKADLVSASRTPPPGVEPGRWANLLSNPPVGNNGTPWSPENWAKALRILDADPRPVIKDNFNKYTKMNADEILTAMHGTKAPIQPPPAPPPRPQSVAPSPTIGQRFRNFLDQTK